MTPDQLAVTAVGLLAILGIAAFFLLPKSADARAIDNASGEQEVLVVVKGGYRPDRILARAGTPIRVTFRRDESSACSERVVFPDFRKSATLPQGKLVEIKLPATPAGEYGFQCEMGMLHGTLVVR